MYRDNHILVVEKPSGLLSVPGKNPLNKDSVLERLKAMYPAAKLVHRLDFGTSGVMLAALTEQAVTHLNKQFQSRRVRKAYIALVAGHLEADSGEIDLPIARGDFPLQKICESGGKRAISRYEVLSRETTGAGFPVSRLRFTPLTGRTHQLRLHSLAISHPIVGCDLYHKMVQFAGRKIDSQQLASRLLLHA
ncbi:MAG: RluA family pseudouridine synthase, partial [Granulosicoccaceae bacterium]